MRKFIKSTIRNSSEAKFTTYIIGTTDIANDRGNQDTVNVNSTLMNQIDPSLVSIPQGTGSNQRIGNNVYLQSIKVRVTLFPSFINSSSAAFYPNTATNVKIYLIKNKKNNATLPVTAADFLSFGFKQSFVDFFKPNFYESFSIKKKWSFNTRSVVSTISTPLIETVDDTQKPYEHSFTINVPVKQNVQFLPSSTSPVNISLAKRYMIYSIVHTPTYKYQGSGTGAPITSYVNQIKATYATIVKFKDV